MRDINLIPDKILKRRRIFLLSALKTLVIAFLILLLAAGLLLRPYQRWTLERENARLAGELEAAGVKELNEAEVSLAEVVRRKEELEAVSRAVPVVQIEAVELIRRISGLMPATVVLGSLDYKQEPGQVQMSVSSASRPDLALFMKRLYNDELFSAVTVSEIEGADGSYSCSVTLQLDKARENN